MSQKSHLNAVCIYIHIQKLIYMTKNVILLNGVAILREKLKIFELLIVNLKDYNYTYIMFFESAVSERVFRTT